MADITVIIPCRDAAMTIGATLASLVSEQSLIREILVVDSGSSDGSGERALGIGRELGLPVKVISTKARCAGESRNRGLDAAEGRWIYFIDADDEHLPGGLASLLNVLSTRRDAEIAIGSFVRSVNGIKRRYKTPRRFSGSPRENASLYISGRISSIGVGCVLVERAAVASLRFPEGLAYDEDTLFWAQLLSRCRVATTDTQIFTYNVDSRRADDRFVTAPRAAFLNWRRSLRRLAEHGVDAISIRRREGIVALKVARVHYARGLFPLARRFLKVARSAPISRGSRWRAFRYRVKIGAALRTARVAPAPASILT